MKILTWVEGSFALYRERVHLRLPHLAPTDVDHEPSARDLSKISRPAPT